MIAGGDANSVGVSYIYDLDDSSSFWRSGPSFYGSHGASVPFGNTFLAVGGYDRQTLQYSDKIYEFNPDPNDERFILRPDRLKSPKQEMAAFLVPDDYATC